MLHPREKVRSKRVREHRRLVEETVALIQSSRPVPDDLRQQLSDAERDLAAGTADVACRVPCFACGAQVDLEDGSAVHVDHAITHIPGKSPVWRYYRSEFGVCAECLERMHQYYLEHWEPAV